jgi:hypothetical protein
LIPPGFAGVYNSPGYCGNGHKTRLDQVGASSGLETWKSVAQHPYFPSLYAVGRQYNPDPIYGNGSSNMMYKGFFAHSLMLSYLMSGESRFTDPQHLVYDNDIQYWYSVTDIVRIMCEQFLQDVDENGSSMAPGIDCEVGKAFPFCIGVGGLACQLHDLALGTDYVRGYDKWLEWAKQNVAGGASSPDSGFAWCAPYVDRDIPYVMSEPRHQAGGLFAGTAWHLLPRAPHFASRLYEGMMEQLGRQNDDGIYIMFPPAAVGVDGLVDTWGTALMVHYAAEIGDVERAEGLKNWMAKNAGVSYDNGEFCFTFNHDEEWPRGLPNAVATLGYIGGAGSWRRMYSEANFDKFRQPTVYGVDYPAVNVTQATYDASRDALVFSIAPGTAKEVR